MALKEITDKDDFQNEYAETTDNPANSESLADQMAKNSEAIKDLGNSIDKMVAGMTSILEHQGDPAVQVMPADSPAKNELATLVGLAKIADQQAKTQILLLEAGSKFGYKMRDAEAQADDAHDELTHQLEKMQSAIDAAQSGGGNQASAIIESLNPVIRQIAEILGAKLPQPKPAAPKQPNE